VRRLLCIALCLLAAPAWALSPQEQANVEVVQRYFRLMFEVRDVDAAAALLAEGYVSHHQPPQSKAQMLARFKRQQGDARPNAQAPHNPALRQIAQGDLVFFQLLAPPRPDKAGDSAKLFFELYRVRDGLLVEHWDAFTEAPGP
jgi:predicted SnoaL-like aldol condensation-catalyzing enzyme